MSDMDKFEKDVLGEDIKVNEVKMIKVDDIVEDGNNPNKMSDAKIEALKKNLKKFGNLVPIIVNKDLVVADGAQRLRAYREMGVKEVPAIVLDVSDVDRRILRQVLNKLRGEHDINLDAEEFLKILEADHGLEELGELLGEDSRGLLELIDSKGSNSDNLDVIDVPEEVKYVVQDGDIWSIGRHRIICGDSTVPIYYKKLLGGSDIKLVFTSPPYNMKAKQYTEYGDDLPSKEFIDFNIKVVDNCKLNLKGFLAWNLSYNANARWEFIEIYSKLIKDSGLKFLELVCWNKKSGLPILSKDMLTRQYEDVLLLGDEVSIKEDLEFIFVGNTEKKAWFNKKSGKGLSNYWEIRPNKIQVNEKRIAGEEEIIKQKKDCTIRWVNVINVINNACFPVELPKKGILMMTQFGDNILDPFMGSGTTMLAAEITGRNGYGIELDPFLVSLCLERLEKATGLKAVKVN